MAKFMVQMTYSTGSLARMINNPGDRQGALEHITKALDGTLESMYWPVGTETSVAVVDLPDAVSASALNTAIDKTGAFKHVDTRELLNQRQLFDVLSLARDAAQTFEIPGH